MRNMSRMRSGAHWSCRGDCLPMVQKRHPHICRWIVGALTRHGPLPFMHALAWRWKLTVSLNPSTTWMAKEGGWSCGQQVLLRGVLASSIGTGASPDQVPDRALPCSRADSHGLTPSPSACSSCVDSTCTSLCPHASATRVGQE